MVGSDIQDKAQPEVGLRSRLLADGGICFLILGICLVISLPRYLIGLDPGDEGCLVYGAARVLDGQVPNRDFFSLQPPFSYYSLAAMFRLFGTSLATERLLGLFLYCLIPLLIYAVSRHRAGRTMALASALAATDLGIPYFNFIPFAVWQGTTAALAAALCMIRSVVTGKAGWAFAGGLATTAALLSRHDQGFYLLISILAYLLVVKLVRQGAGGRPGAILAAWSAGLGLPMLVLGGYWWSVGAIPAMYRELVMFPLTTYAKTSSLPMPRLDGAGPVDYNITVAMFYLPLLINASAGIHLLMLAKRRRFDLGFAHLSFLLLFSTLFYCQLLTRSDFAHMLITLNPLFILTGWMIDGMVASRMRQRMLLYGGVILVEVGFLAYMAPDSMRQKQDNLTELQTPRGGVLMDQMTTLVVTQLVDLVQTNTPQKSSILVLPYSPIVYFITDRRNPTRWNYLWPGDQTAEDHQTLVRQALYDPPAIVLLVRDNGMETYAKTVLDYVRTNLILKGESSQIRIYMPYGK